MTATEEQSIILFLWTQFAYDGGKNGKRLWAGGLSALESAENYLQKNKLINTWGRPKKGLIY